MIDDYAHHPTEVAATLNAARTLAPKRLVAVFQPHLYSRTALLAESSARRWRLPTSSWCSTSIQHASAPRTIPASAERRSCARPSRMRRDVRCCGGRGSTRRSEALEGLLEDGDLCVVMGAGDVDVLGPTTGGWRGCLEIRRRPRPRSCNAIFRLPVWRRSGPAAMPTISLAPGATLNCASCSPGRARSRYRSLVVGSGSNLLIADEGVPGLVIKLDRKLAQVQHEGQRIVCGGGARLPSVAARAAQAGLSGIEFGVNIPGSVGGALRMNANAYGGQLADTLEWAEIVTAEGLDRRAPAQLGLRLSPLQSASPAKSSRVPRSCSSRPAWTRSRRHSRRCAPAATRPSPRESRRSAPPSRTRRRPEGRGTQRRAAAVRGRTATAWPSAARALRPSTPISSRTRALPRRPTCWR